MKEYLTYLYKICKESNTNGIDSVYDVFCGLSAEQKYEAINSLLTDLDFERVSLSILYTIARLTVAHKDHVEYATFYQKCREEYARRGEDSERIARLFDKLEPATYKVTDRSQYQTLEEREESDWQKLDDKIAWAKTTDDKDLIHYLEVYKLYRINQKERDMKFRQLKNDLGEEEIRKRAIKSLKEMAEILEKSEGCWPGIYYVKLPSDPLLGKTFIDGIEVIISYPWPA